MVHTPISDKVAMMLYYNWIKRLKEEAEDLSSQVLFPGLLMVHDTTRCGHNNKSELSGRQKLGGPSLNVPDTNVESEIKRKVTQRQ